ncbi:CD8A protein, partial [Bombycilla garrulus]|nr:CD8A protein [Bombycilla garrulus]
MDTPPTLLLLLALGFCCPGMHGQPLEIKVKSPKDTTKLQLGQRLELECWTEKDSGAFWIRQDKSGTLHFIAYINSLSRVTFGGNQKSHFEASKGEKIYRLAVKSFTPQDEGKYFCTMIVNQMLYFSSAQLVFLSGQQHLHPASLSPDKTASTSCPCPSQPAIPPTSPTSLLACPRRTQEDLDFSCHIFIWVPLAGACLLLLIALVTTIALCRQTRRRRCRCKR